MYRRITGTAAAFLCAAASTAFAAGPDRAGQPITALFEKDSYVEIGIAFSSPDVSGTDALGLDTGDATGAYELFNTAIKADITPDFSMAFITDQPFTADVRFRENGSGYHNTTVNQTSGVKGRTNAATLLARYKLGSGFSVHGGIRMMTGYQRFNLRGELYRLASLPTGIFDGYDVNFKRDTGTGFVLGGAYENPALGQRISITYNSEVEFEHDTVESLGFGTVPVGESTTEVTAPQSVNLEFRQGLSQTSLLFGSVRWVDWEGYEVSPEFLFTNAGAPLYEYTNDSLTYRLGYGRRFSEEWAGAVYVGYDSGFGGLSTSLGVTDGYRLLGGAVTYTTPNGVRLTGSINLFDVGDSTTSIGGNPIAEFKDNRSITYGFRIASNF